MNILMHTAGSVMIRSGEETTVLDIPKEGPHPNTKSSPLSAVTISQYQGDREGDIPVRQALWLEPQAI